MSASKGNHVVVLEGRGSLTLRPSDHIATGGEGSVYRASGTVIKLYTDARKMARDGMAEKLRLLTSIDHPFIVNPKGLVLDNRSRPIGYWMNFVEGEPLSRVFTNDFRKREGFDDDDAIKLVDGMRTVVSFAHQKGATLVDANEMNWIAYLQGHDGPQPRVIDVDSWAIGSWPATVIMPSIRDWHTTSFTQLTDWFAWGIVTFQVFTGIHPYKGKLDGFDRGDLEGRMKAHASVFDKNVRLNRAVRDFSGIPGRLLDWYMATFAYGERSEPPSPYESGGATPAATRVLRVTTTNQTGLVVFEKLFGDRSDPVRRVFPCGVVLLESGRLIELSRGRHIASTSSHTCEVVKVQGGWLRGECEGRRNTLMFHYINEVSLQEQECPVHVKGRHLVRYNDRLFVVTERGLTEMNLKILGRPLLTVGNTWGVVVNSTRWFDGVGVQDAMGAMFIIAPFGEKACAQVRVRELDGLRVVMALAGNRFVVLTVLDQQGDYKKVELTFNRDYTSYTAWIGDVDTPDLNVALLPKGVSAMIVNDGQLDIFVPTNGSLNKVQDKDITADMILARWGDTVVYIKDGAVWSIRLTS